MEKKVKDWSTNDIGKEVSINACFTFLEKTSKNNSKYYSLTIRDGSAVAYATVWNRTKNQDLIELIKTVNPKTKVKITGVIREAKYDENTFNSIDITQIDVMEDIKEKVSDSTTQKDEIKKIVNSIKNPGYKKLIKEVLASIDTKVLFTIPYSVTNFVYTGGLVDHIVRVAHMTEAIIDTYNGSLKIDKDFMLTLVILFRLGKVKTISYVNNTARVTEDGELYGNSIISRDIVREKITDIKEIDEYDKKLLLHAIQTIDFDEKPENNVIGPKTVAPQILKAVEKISIILDNFETAEESRIDNENIVYGPNGIVRIISSKEGEE